VLAVAFGNKLIGSNPIVGLFLNVATAVERGLGVDLGNYYVGSSPTVGISFMYAR